LFDLFRDYSVVIVQDDEIVGYLLAGAEPAQSGAPDIGWLLGLGVLPEACGRGFGRQLLTRCLDLRASAGIDSLKIAVRPTNASANQLFMESGFERLYDEVDYFGPDQPRSVLCPDLRRMAQDGPTGRGTAR
jgi:ribosomal protein S18 acetylase RimI-like enzyme